ncbi:MazG nucleotide pyrophosphohydrolase domain-containing protein [Kineosporia sp. NBRC 101731]|uniref:MazG nucleotide pyrophosphohydrolase domain-containing protein n=1 Tax=Kineosporia sp. NBRC 101731 TaxID=3032199 RepID=UPI00249FA76D|nr:MazG nucleotide pyrophosphohydrolase domain-containing protein [Kineosporia sp. NBRC 101731]GLY29271.1 hypothetical protein Kisp02_26360 [Kineosporia sp. NBRC 101731]
MTDDAVRFGGGDLRSLTAALEQVSQGYAQRFGIERDPAWFLLKLQEELGELTQAYLAVSGQGRSRDRTPGQLREDLENELADVLAHVLILAHHHGIDPELAVQRKWLSWLETPNGN